MSSEIRENPSFSSPDRGEIMSSSAPSPPQASTPTEFTLFPLLPSELRIQVWEESLHPRVLELHSPWESDCGTKGWQSRCSNPAALSVCVEARDIALAYYTVALPLYKSLGYRASTHRRLLYLNPASDVVAVLGDLRYPHLGGLLEVVRQLDPAGRGLKHLGFGITCWPGDMWAAFSDKERELFDRLERLLLLMYAEQRPPTYFHDGECALEACEGMEWLERVLLTPVGPWASERTSWLTRRPIHIANLSFIPGPKSCQRFPPRKQYYDSRGRRPPRRI
ncbi:hypothetical protein AAE478_004492 [Parahypoxylon ruwenzoriense]